MEQLKSLVEFELSGKIVFVRSDLNVPLDVNGKILDDTRIKASIPTINYALKNGATVLVTSHLGRPEEGFYDETLSLAPVVKKLEKLTNKKIRLIKNWCNKKVKFFSGELVVLENCRFNVGEMDNNFELADKMSQMFDIYVNDAFGTAHRKEATVSKLAQLKEARCAGFLFLKEVDALTKAFNNPKKPLLAILGGAKVSSKLNLLYSLIGSVDYLIVGGGIANTFLKSRGIEVGRSIHEAKLVSTANEIFDLASIKNVEMPLPSDVIVAESPESLQTIRLTNVENINKKEMILDFGPQTLNSLKSLVKKSNTIIWNGPLGLFEIDEFASGTNIIAKEIGLSKAYSVIGGGDTISAINKFNVKDDIDYVSTGGGAFLEFLKDRNLPAISALMGRD